jgi:hypothetical protein
VARSALLHERVSVVGTPAAASAGLRSRGEDGGATIVVNGRSAENALVPPLLEAFTLQKYRVAFCIRFVWSVVSARTLSTSVLAKSESADSCNRYEVARAAAFQMNVSDVGWLAALFAGETSAGVAGAAMIVVNGLTAEKVLVPPILEALTRQK